MGIATAAVVLSRRGSIRRGLSTGAGMSAAVIRQPRLGAAVRKGCCCMVATLSVP